MKKKSIVTNRIFDSLMPETYRYLALPGADTANIATINQYISTIKSGGTVTLSSLTAKFSTVAGTEFVTQVSTDLRWLSFLGAKLTWSDGANSAVTYAGAAGSGETYSSEILTDWTNHAANLYETLDVSSPPNITSAINTAGNGIAYKDIGSAGGKLLDYLSDLTINSGTLYKVETGGNTVGGAPATLMTTINATSSKSISKTFTAPTGTTHFLVYADAAVNFSTANQTLKQHLTPSSTGLILTSPTWGSFAPNSAAFNLTITKRDI